MSFPERFEILRVPVPGDDPDLFALRFVFGNGDRRVIGADFRRKGDARNIAQAIEAGVMAAHTGTSQTGAIEIRDLTLLEDDGRPSPYHRANRGTVVHLEACGFSRLAESSIPWTLVRHWPPQEVIREVDSLPWLSLCQRCWPPVIRRLDEAQVQGMIIDA